MPGEMRVIMATNTKSRKPVATVTREAMAEVVNAETVAAATGRMLADSFASENTGRDERLFEQARLAFEGQASGGKPADIAKAATSAMAARFPESSRAWAEDTSVVNGGAKVTRVTIVQRSDAYASILNAGINTPTVSLVATAYRAFTSKGAPGLADARKRFEKDVAALPAGERAAYYESNARGVSKAVADAKKKASDAKKSETSAANAADAKAEAGEPVTLDTAAEFVALIRAELARPWSDDDRAFIMAALSEIVAE